MGDSTHIRRISKINHSGLEYSAGLGHGIYSFFGKGVSVGGQYVFHQFPIATATKWRISYLTGCFQRQSIRLMTSSLIKHSGAICSTTAHWKLVSAYKKH